MNQPIQFGKYFLLERINMGGMAEVFRAKAYGVEGFERLVAVKRILPSISEDKEFIRMFIDEAKIAVQLSHANIAQVFDLGRVGGSYYIALEHVHGRDLRALYDRCRERNEPMPLAMACFLVMKACEGLDYAHQKRNQAGEPLGLVHRDVSPQNILVSFEGEVKIIDFGIAKAAGRCSKTQAGILKGKFAYMSPEQVRGLAIDRRSDIFSIGIVLYELLTGKRLFVGESDFSTLEKVRKAEIVAPSTYNSRIPKALERIVLKALARDRGERYQNAIDLHDDLQSFMYSAGEFYSRKDMAAWLKSHFANEIAAEAAKLEAFRQLRPPEAPRTTFGRVSGDTRPLTSVIAHNTQRTALERHRSPTQDVGRTRMTQSNAWDSSTGGGFMGPGFESELAYGRNSTTAHVTAHEVAPARPASRSLRKPPMVSGRSEAVGEGSTPVPTVDAQLIGLTPLPSVEERRVMVAQVAQAQPAPKSVAPPRAIEPLPLPPPEPPRPPLVITQVESLPPRYQDVAPLPQASPMLLLPEPRVVVRRPRSNGAMVFTVAILFLIAGGGGAGAYFFTTHRGLSATDLPFIGEQAEPPPEAPPPEPTPRKAVARTEAPAPRPARAEIDPNTGFDLVVEPRGAQVRLNGKLLGESPPLSIRNLPPGEHRVEVIAPRGYKDVEETVTVRLGQAQRVSLKLVPASLRGNFKSTPIGADVILFADGKEQRLGATPVSVDLEPNTTYLVSFEKPGFTTVTQPLQAEEADLELAVTLEKTATPPRPVQARTPRVEADAEDFVPSDRADFADVREAMERPTAPVREQPTPTPPAVDDDSIDDEAGEGTLAIQAKPPCRILVDNVDTGRTTPQRSLRLSAGTHRITLVNDEYGIRDSFRVKIRAGQVSRQIRDLTDQIR